VDTIRWFELPPCYVFHPMNAWEDGSLIHAEVMEYPQGPHLFSNPDGSKGAGSPAILVRWTFDLAAPTNGVKRTVLDDMAGEFPRFDERRTGLSYRHGWFASLADGGNSLGGFDSLSHIDLATGQRTTMMLAPGDNPSEPVFVPRSADAPEGEGWILAPVYRGAEDRSDLIILDAQDILAGPVATIRVPRRVPFGFHGNWVGA
jgi:carotenoid cleavage dioxygenase